MAKDVLSDSYYFFRRDGLSHDLDICPSFETLVSFRTVSKWICSYHKLRHYNFCTMVTVWACHYLYYWCLYEVLARCENHCPNKICSKALHPIKCYGKKNGCEYFSGTLSVTREGRRLLTCHTRSHQQDSFPKQVIPF